MRKIIVRSIVCINKFAIYKSINYIEIFIDFLIFNTINNKLKKKELEKLQDIDLYIILFINRKQLEQQY